ncbi:hypothetical protein E2C01_065581 [Portunus trituberculatus]|uniref:Uncharacterized protein n=1 Tax=Portunus trituberculatus TaxID=210409 RepID=A0A5B7HPZ6_PORTR|nr:hypothetical protein [Portunus trituberculatus]
MLSLLPFSLSFPPDFTPLHPTRPFSILPRPVLPCPAPSRLAPSRPSPPYPAPPSSTLPRPASHISTLSCDAIDLPRASRMCRR